MAESDLTPEKVLEMIQQNKDCEDAIFLIWNFANDLNNPFLFIQALALMTEKKNSVEASFSSHPDTLDFLFDHYYPMLQSGPLTNPVHIQNRIRLIEMLCHLLIYHPNNISRFQNYLARVWKRLLHIMKKSNFILQVAAFRSAIDLYQRCYEKINEDDQAAWMLNLIISNPPSSPLHFPAIRFAMAIRPEKFGFISLCKTVIDQGITQPQEYGIISKILILPVIKNPTDILQHLCLKSVSKDYLSSSARKALRKPLVKFQDLQQFVPWFKLFIKRAIQFVGFAQKAKKYHSRRYNIAQFCQMLMELNISWIIEIILQTVNTIQSLQLGINLFADVKAVPVAGSIQQGVDEKIKEEMNTNVDSIDLKEYFLLDKIKTSLPLKGNANESGKPTVSQIKSQFLARKGNNAQITDLSVLDQLPGPPSASRGQKSNPQNNDAPEFNDVKAEETTDVKNEENPEE